ncbi:ribosome small subunit-dependent GTPase A [Miltoncostaea marina]|uniref:ribosome small subunit-dependent GTPase A n=1 Tax=Miltoncostaea marina TaxID=2843215 RepID=UPI001C3D2C0F|nr:ribosome small subunit-dependent GTPase A [Miltoncostaea marina]
MSSSTWAALAPLGWDEGRAAELAALDDDALAPGRVARVDRGGGLALTAGGAVPVAAPGLAAGDWLALRDGRVAAVLERRTRIVRRAAGRADAAQVMAANVDVLVAVHALDRPLRVRRLHRALALAWEAGARPVVAIAKADLGPDPEAEAVIGALGAPLLPVSARTGEGIDALAALARPSRTLVLLGESGAGKSSLVNALLGRDELATGGVRRGDAKGRHTTTARHLLPLPGGGAVIDTPGVRELGLWSEGDGGAGVAVTFGDVEELAGGCRFADCTHRSEPGCAVRAAVDEGRLAEDRLASYRDLTRELEALERRGDERARRRHGRAGARMVREAVRMKRRR